MCADFVAEAVGALGVRGDDVAPTRGVVANMAALSDSLITPEEGQNPEAGLYIFYKKYDDGVTGHTGIVLFDEDGNASILHNGSNGAGSENVNERTRGSSDFNTWFTNDTKYDVEYKRINREE
jgi:hypothetical protein